jgi:hypothetical protein
MKVLERVAHLYRVCGIESLYLKNSVPKAWITSKSSKSKGNANVASDSLIADPNDRRIKNTRYIRYLLSQTTSFIVPTLQGFFSFFFHI